MMKRDFGELGGGGGGGNGMHPHAPAGADSISSSSSSSSTAHLPSTPSSHLLLAKKEEEASALREANNALQTALTTAHEQLASLDRDNRILKKGMSIQNGKVERCEVRFSPTQQDTGGRSNQLDLSSSSHPPPIPPTDP